MPPRASRIATSIYRGFAVCPRNLTAARRAAPRPRDQGEGVEEDEDGGAAASVFSGSASEEKR